MKNKRLVVVVTGVAGALLAASALAGATDGTSAPANLVQEVRQATEGFQDVDAAVAAGYGSAGSCVSGPEEGAMGIHFPNGTLVEDPALAAGQPEMLVYEQRGHQLELLGVEYLTIAEAWHATNAGPPVLLGQHFNYVSSPNRYGLPAFYELHVWAWKENPHGMFVDWNPAVSCEDYTGEQSADHAGH